jgi:hypothetical protein
MLQSWPFGYQQLKFQFHFLASVFNLLPEGRAVDYAQEEDSGGRKLPRWAASDSR